MTEEELGILNHFNGVVAECGLFCFCTRDASLQRAACDRLEETKTLIEAEKINAIYRNNETFANDLLGCSSLASAMIAELKMWMLLKEQNPDAAWTQLVCAQDHLANAMKASEGFAHLLKQIRRLNSIETIVFPPQIFFSSGMLVKEETCSICGEEYEDCPHVKGRPYMGQLCVVRLTPFKADHIALVKQPASKYCRAHTRATGEGVRNIMTGLIEASGQESGEASDQLSLHGIIATTSTLEESDL